MNKSDITRLITIYNYCNYINETIISINSDKNAFINNRDIQFSLAFQVMQIGENASRLSSEFITEFSEIPWKQIIGSRNVIAHEYNSKTFKFDKNILWKTIIDDVPKLKAQIETIFNQNNINYKTKEIIF